MFFQTERKIKQHQPRAGSSPPFLEKDMTMTDDNTASEDPKDCVMHYDQEMLLHHLIAFQDEIGSDGIEVTEEDLLDAWH